MKAGIIGAGIMGRLLAWHLAHAGWEVSLFDQGSENSCSHAAAGLLTPLAELEKNDSIIYELGKEALSYYWPTLLSSFRETVFFQQKGSLIVSHPRDQYELVRLAQIISSKVDDQNHYQELNEDEIKNLEPQLTKFQSGLYFPSEGQIDCQALLTTLKDGLIEKIEWHEKTTVKDIQARKVILREQTINVDMVFDCRGLAAKSMFDDMRGVRGELIWLHAPDVHIGRPIRLMHPRYNLYIAPRPNQYYLIGATEIESSDVSAISVRAVLELLTAAYSIHPGFCEARMIKTVTQCRPTLSNHLPKIKYRDGLIAINGLYRHGYLIAPSLVSEVMRWLSQGIQKIRYPQLWEMCT